MPLVWMAAYWNVCERVVDLCHTLRQGGLCRPPHGEQKGVQQFLLGLVSAVLPLTEGDWEWVRRVEEEEMPSPRSHSSDLGGDAVLALLKIKGQGRTFAQNENHQEKYKSR